MEPVLLKNKTELAGEEYCNQFETGTISSRLQLSPFTHVFLALEIISTSAKER